ncbi:3-hydroxyisobutyrate dehydrogenase [Raphidocelis subcapitata]|uniref:3-hydroxyisobutyrate dehydrogenase n=1 Tax=Raphidocelis subcapitata TaxID=307507 RepID=A0A2V0P9P6_9CHLO|nr:3-hydroxyisobutyrate dehydrogenase [Raphidocelis subcapitata]|eukprot:GBF94623.1 3-hydroxyisobutyrate dehydrogenase [Raphidocelis subcapitata]
MIRAAAACSGGLLGRAGAALWCAATSRGFAAAGSAAAEPYKVGLIGLGRMGARMAPRLLDAGHDLVVNDSNGLAVERIREIGAQHPNGSVTVRDSPAALAATPGVGAVLTVLPDPASLTEVFTGARGLLAAPGGLRPSLFINISTVDPDTARRLAERVARAQLAPGAAPLTASGRPALLDAPATGGVAGAEGGALCFSVGAADAADIGAARPLLRVLGSHITHCGPVGAGSVAKLCNALVMSSTMVAVAEALALGKRLNLDPAVLTDVLLSGSGRSWVVEKNNPAPGVAADSPASNGYRPGQQVDQVREQLLMLIAAGERVHSPTPMAKFAEEQYRVLHDEGVGGKDFSAIYRYRYGSGCDNAEWKSGEQLFSSQIP